MAGAAALAGLAYSNAHPDISSDVSYLNSALGDLQSDASFTDLQTDVTNLDSTLNNVLQLIESARAKGYRYQKDLDEQANDASSRWQAVRDQVINTINQQAYTFQNRLNILNPSINRLNSVMSVPGSARPVISTTQSQVNAMRSDLDKVQRNIESMYSQVETQVQQLNSRLSSIHWALEQLASASFQLETGEELVMAVAARWDREGNNDPEGILYLTGKRLIFEQKEKVATKKVLFITTATELVQKVLVSQAFAGIRSSKADNKGLFGHQDFLLVEFADPKLGSVAFHLNGQESSVWHDLLSRARSGQLQSERFTGTGVSMADLNRPITTADILSMQGDVNELQDEMMLQTARQELSGLENELSGLERKLAGLRSQSYVVEKDLEGDIKVLAAQWERVKTNANTTIEQQTRVLSEQMRSIHQQLAQLTGMASNLTQARPLFMQLKSAVASAEAQADAAESTVLTQFDEYGDEVETLGAHLDWVEWMLGALATASFRLLATECGIAAVEAVWAAPGLEPENGILYLTDQRLLWEDRVGDYELKFEEPLQNVTGSHKAAGEAAGEEQIPFEFLAFTFGPGSRLENTRFQLSMPVADDWVKMVGRARTGGYAQDRSVEIDPAELERIRNSPQQCTTCGAALTAPVLRGQTEINCQYCGKVMRI